MSQNSDILKALKKGRKINPLMALSEWGVFRLAARVKNLREQGYDIATNMKKSANGKRFAEYKLEVSK